MQDFKWTSLLGISSIGFMTIAVVYILIGTAGAIIVGTKGSGNVSGSYYYSAKVDELLFGKPIKQLNTENPIWGKYITTMMIAFCSFMIALGIMQLGVARFALPNKEMWSLIGLVVSNLVMLVIYWVVLIIPVMIKYNVGYFELWHPYALVPTLLLVPSTVLAWIGMN